MDKEKCKASWTLCDELIDLAGLSDKIYHLAKRVQGAFETTEPEPGWAQKYYEDTMYDTLFMLDYAYELTKLSEKLNELQAEREGGNNDRA